MGRPVVHFEIVGADDDVLHPFYSEMFGWSIDKANPVGYGIVDRQSNLNDEGIGIGGGIMGTRGMENMDEVSYVTVYVEVPDVEEALQRAEELGGQRVMGPMDVPGGGPRLGMFNDPEGHTIGVVQEGSVS